MRAFSFFRSAMILSCVSLALGCQKEGDFLSSSQEQAVAAASKKPAAQKQVTRAYRDSFGVVLTFYPDAGWTPADPDAPAWYTGTGSGHATHMGNATTYFNTHTLRVAGTVMVYHARVGMYYATQVAPFGVQPEDEISAVNVDSKGNSIWIKVEPEGLRTWHLDETQIAMQGKARIVGGTGKFAGATGETDFHGAFDQASWVPANHTFQDASIWQKGWIRY